MKKTALIVVITLSVTTITFVATKKFSLVRQNVILDDPQTSLLVTLGDSALQHLDVPVSSILVYNDTIIGTGYNTVIAHGDAGGHAEINAISSALKALGKERFNSLDRKNLVLITTFEPCLMCRGAVIEYNIRNVVFLKQKSLSHWLLKQYQELRYEVTKKQGEPESLQDSLFMKHPRYSLKAGN
ncbi:MAG: nucleoside deaminase [Bacteroidota bacterium]